MNQKPLACECYYHRLIFFSHPHLVFALALTFYPPELRDGEVPWDEWFTLLYLPSTNEQYFVFVGVAIKKIKTCIYLY